MVFLSYILGVFFSYITVCKFSFFDINKFLLLCLLLFIIIIIFFFLLSKREYKKKYGLFVIVFFLFILGFINASDKIIDKKEILNTLKKGDNVKLDVIFKEYVYKNFGKSKIACVSNIKQQKVQYLFDIKNITKIEYSDRFLFTGKIEKIYSTGIDIKCYVKSLGFIKIKKGRPSFKNRIFILRDKISDMFKRYEEIYGYSGFSILNGILLGDRSKISYDLKNKFINAGVYHIFAISGLHVVIIYLTCLMLFSFLKIPLLYNRIFTILFLSFYAVFTGGNASVIRAVLMTIIYVFISCLGREKNNFNILILCAFIILLIEPLYIVDVGFQLSFTAVFTILFCVPLLKRIEHVLNLENIFCIYLLRFIFISIVVQIMLIPLLSFYFGNIVFISVIGNTLILPIISMFLVLGWILILCSVFPFLNFYIAQLIYLTIKYIIFVIENINLLNFMNLQYKFSLMQVCSYYFVLFIVWKLRKIRLNRSLHDISE